MSASWRPSIKREPVDLALRALARLRDVQVVARDARAERDGYALIAAVAFEAHAAGADVESGLAFALQPHVADASIGRHARSPPPHWSDMRPRAARRSPRSPCNRCPPSATTSTRG